MEEGSSNKSKNIKLPWTEIRVSYSSDANLEILPARYAIQNILEEMFNFFERTLTFVVDKEPLDKPLNKSIRSSEDLYFTSLLRALNELCESCLPSVLVVLIKWYEKQQKVSLSEIGEIKDKAIKKTLGASYLFCNVLIEILPQLHFHPGNECESQIIFIVETSFKQISYKDPAIYGINYNNSLLVAEIFAEVIGVLSQSHYKEIQDKFLNTLDEFRKEVPVTSATIRSIICLLMGMAFISRKLKFYIAFTS